MAPLSCEECGKTYRSRYRGKHPRCEQCRKNPSVATSSNADDCIAPIAPMKPLHLLDLGSDHNLLKRYGASLMTDDALSFINPRLERIEQILEILNWQLWRPIDTDPLVHLTPEISVPTMALLPAAIEGAAAHFSMADLRSWALVCKAWAGWVRRLLRDPTALGAMWRRLLLGFVEDHKLGEVRNPDLATRARYTAALQEQRYRDASTTGTLEQRYGDATPTRIEDVTFASDVAATIADVWAYFANTFYHRNGYHSVRGHGYHPKNNTGLGVPFPFEPYLTPQGEYPSGTTSLTRANVSRTRYVEETTHLIVSMFNLINDYVDWVKEEHDPSRNRVLEWFLIKQLEQFWSQMMRFLGMGPDVDSEEAFRERMTIKVVNKFTKMLSDYAYLFPQKADVDRTYKDKKIRGKPIHAGQFESVLEEVIEDKYVVGDGLIRYWQFQVIEPMSKSAFERSTGIFMPSYLSHFA